MLHLNTAHISTRKSVFVKSLQCKRNEELWNWGCLGCDNVKVDKLCFHVCPVNNLCYKKSTTSSSTITKWKTVLTIKDWGSAFLWESTILSKTRAIWKKETANKDFKSKIKMTSIKKVVDAIRKGSNPSSTINTKWPVYDQYMKKVYSLWKTPFLPIKLQNLHLHIINHKLKLNNQLKHFARDKNKHLVSGKCTFCTINNISNHSEESYTHLFLECRSRISALTPIAIRYNI